MTITFYKDNKIIQEHTKEVADIISEFYETDESKYEAPFERLILNFMSVTYGSFDILSDNQWKALFDENKKFNQ